jgi:polyhydroxyalkanoate synthesis regulator phasin
MVDMISFLEISFKKKMNELDECLKILKKRIRKLKPIISDLKNKRKIQSSSCPNGAMI